MADNFLINSANKNNFNKFLAKKFLCHRDSILTNYPQQVPDESVSIIKCQTEEAHERVILYTLHCVGQQI